MRFHTVHVLNEVEVHGVLYDFLNTQYKRDSRPTAFLIDLRHDRGYILYEDLRYVQITNGHELAMVMVVIGSLNEQSTATIQIGTDLRIAKSKRLQCGAIYSLRSPFE